MGGTAEDSVVEVEVKEGALVRVGGQTFQVVHKLNDKGSKMSIGKECLSAYKTGIDTL